MDGHRATAYATLINSIARQKHLHQRRCSLGRRLDIVDTLGQLVHQLAKTDISVMVIQAA